MKKENGAPKKRVKKSVIIKRVIAAVLTLAILGGLYYLGTKLWPAESKNEQEESRIRRNSYDTTTKDKKMSNEYLEFTMYPTTSHFTLKEKKTGRVWMSNPDADKGGVASDPGKVAIGSSQLNDMRSTLIVSYSASSADKDLNNWEYSIDKQAYVIEEVKNDEDVTTEIRVLYTIGQIQGIATIPQVLTNERYDEILTRIKNSPDDKTKRLDKAFTPNYENAQTIREMALSTRLELRQLAAHVLRLSVTMDALEQEENLWIQKLIDDLETASIIPYQREAVQAVIDEHAEALKDLESFAEWALSEDEEERKEASELLNARIKELDDNPGDMPEEEAEAAIEWMTDLKGMIERPNVEPVDLEALAATITSNPNHFFGEEEEAAAEKMEPILALVQSEEYEDKKTAAEQIREFVSEAELSKEKNKWIAELADALDASGGEGYDNTAVKGMIEEADAEPARKELLDRAFRRAKFMRAEAKENILKALKGDEKVQGIDYTDEEYLRDAQWALSGDSDSSIRFDITVVYRLDGPDLIVEVPYDEIKYNEDAPITYLNILPMFGAVGGTNGEYEDGFLFVPEGGGALIRYNNGKLQQNSYIANLYGWDYASKRSEVVNETKITFPVFGLTSKGGSFICIIEEGASYASIKADINGKPGTNTAFHPNSFNTVSAKYHVLHSDQYNVSDKTPSMVLMYEKSMPKNTVRQRYRFLNSDSYVDMAGAYGDYLRDSHPELQASDASEEMPVSVELVGAIDKRVVTAGLPVQRVLATTTFSEMKTVIDDLVSQGVKEISVRASGWCNGGIRQHVLTSVNVEGVLGGAQGMKDLIAYAKEKGVRLYFDGITAFAYDTKLFQGFTPRANAARFTTREIVEITPYSKVYYTEDDDQAVYYLTRPDYAQQNASNLIKALRDKGAYGVAFRDIGHLLSGNYDPRDTTTREEVKAMNIDTMLQARDSGESIMIRDGFDFALPYADIVTDMDLSGVSYSLLDATVPFYQIAIHGSLDYTGPSLNLSSDWHTDFLRCVEYGAGLNFTFLYEDAKILQDTMHTAYYGTSYGAWRQEAIDTITRYQREMAGLNRSRITGHMALPLNVTKTTYADGTDVYVNYGSDDYTLDDGNVVPARDYLVVREQEGVADAKIQAVFEPNGARSLVNFTAVSLTAGDTVLRPCTTVRLQDGEVFDVIFADALESDPAEGQHTRVYVNASDEAVSVSGGLEIPARSYRWATDDTQAEAIFLPDGSRMYVNYGDAAINYGYTFKEDGNVDKAAVLNAGTYVRIRDEQNVDAMILADGTVLLVNCTDEALTVNGETVPAKGWIKSENPDPVQVIFRADGSRMYLNRTEADLKPGTRTVGALNWLPVSGDQALDLLLTGEGNRVWVNASDAAITAGNTEIPAHSSVLEPTEAGVTVVFLPDGSRMYANFTDALVKTDNTNSRNTGAGNYQLVTAEIDLDVLVLPDGDLWVNSTDKEIRVGDIAIPAKGTAKTENADGAAEVILLADGTRRYVNHGTTPLAINGVNVQGMCWAPDSAAIGDAPLPDGLEKVIFYNLSDADVPFGAVTVPAGQILIPDPVTEPELAAEEPAAETPAAETPADQASGTEEGGDKK